MKKKFTTKFNCSAEEALKKVTDLLKIRSVGFSINGNKITLTSFPIPITSGDRKQYSRNNWIGVNPFVFLSEMEITVKENYLNTSIINVTAKSSRVYLFLLIPLFIAGIAFKDGTYEVIVIMGVLSSLFTFFVYQGILGSALSQELKNCSNQQVDPIVKTSADKVEAQGTQGHP